MKRINGELIATAFDLGNLVDYQGNSVVSKTLVQKEHGSVTLFSFDEGEGLSEHISYYDAMVSIIEGEALINIEGKGVIAKAGQMVIMPNNKPHSLQAVKKFKMLLIMIKE